MFKVYLELGIDHILDLNGYDHMLFILVLVVPFVLRDWKKLIALVTAFTIGHSLTLALAALDIVNFDPYWIELFIPLTILIASLQNIVRLSDKTQNRLSLYPLVLAFGFIHGLGFSNYFTSLLGREADIILPLFAFNIGVEVAQIGLVALYIAIGYVLVNLLGLKQKYWILSMSAITALFSIYTIIERI